MPRYSQNRVIVVPVLQPPPFQQGVAEQLTGSKNRSILWFDFYESPCQLELKLENKIQFMKLLVYAERNRLLDV